MTDASPGLSVLGQLSIDDVVLPDGRTDMGGCGGDATYAALSASLWLDHVGVVAPAGRDFPAGHLDRLRELGLDLAGVVARPGSAIRYWVIYEADGRRRWLQRSPESAFTDTAPDPSDVPPAFRRSGAFHIAAMPLVDVERLIAAIRSWAPAAVITLDTHEDEVAGFQDRIAALLPSVTAFLPSREEVASWFGWDDPVRAIRELGGLGQRMTVIKMGPDGSLVHDARTGRLVEVGVAPGPVVDVTGAGDAFCGSFAAGLVLRDEPADAARRGAAGASLAVGAFGTLHEWSRATAASRL
ncbi:MAG TPA: carbohydrate kinase family protein, partial [Candidatus Deferrimicrobium sp.]|nr:carbohydrate kinase family protein [Candidatus Deferrimicrobium sp.]